jgi:hypothetical protein
VIDVDRCFVAYRAHGCAAISAWRPPPQRGSPSSSEASCSRSTGSERSSGAGPWPRAAWSWSAKSSSPSQHRSRSAAAHCAASSTAPLHPRRTRAGRHHRHCQRRGVTAPTGGWCHRRGPDRGERRGEPGLQAGGTAAIARGAGTDHRGRRVGLVAVADLGARSIDSARSGPTGGGAGRCRQRGRGAFRERSLPLDLSSRRHRGEPQHHHGVSIAADNPKVGFSECATHPPEPAGQHQDQGCDDAESVPCGATEQLALVEHAPLPAN